MNITKDFFFISYSQKDGEVAEDTGFFSENYVNFWIDTDGMRATDDSWIKRAEKTISDPSCKGAVFFLSVNSLASEAVETEIDLVLNKKKECPDFFVFAVLMDGYSIPHLIKRLYMSFDDLSLAKALPLSRIVKLSALFSDEKIYIVRDPKRLETYRQKLLTTLSECGVVLNREFIEGELKNENKLDAYKRYSFGMYYGQETVSNVHIPHTEVFVEKNGSWYIKLEDKTIHPAEPIKWIILDYSQGTMVMISEKVLDKIPGREIDTWLNQRFLSLAFSERERDMIVGPVRTLTYEEYTEYSEHESINPTNGTFWLDSINKRGQQNMLMCVNGSKINTIGYPKNMKNGIRPVIGIQVDRMLEGMNNG